MNAKPAPPPLLAPTPFVWRVGLLAVVAAIGGLTFPAGQAFGPQAQSALGALAFLVFAAAFSVNLRLVNWRTVITGIALQIGLALAVLKVGFVQEALRSVGGGVSNLLNYSSAGATFVFGNLSNYPDMERVFAVPTKDNFLFPFAFIALPPIIFISSFFTVLYYFGVLQLLVKGMARAMMYVMGTSGAETLSVSANVFMGQTEAPLIVKPFVPRMTQSELLALMIGGMAHVSGGMMAVYIKYGADPVAILTTCVMACPCSLYLAKLLLPETGVPETSGTAQPVVERTHANAIDAAAAGASDGLKLALNVAAMLIAFLAFIAMFNGLVSGIKPLLIDQFHVPKDKMEWLPDNLSLEMISGWVFAPIAYLMGVDKDECLKVGSLLGIKLFANEHVAYLTLTKKPEFANLSARTFTLTTFALTGFANFASIGIQIGGIGAMAPERRKDLARLGGRALFAGFLATLINASMAGAISELNARPAAQPPTPAVAKPPAGHE